MGEVEGGRGSEGIASVLANHIRQEGENHIPVIFYYASCRIKTANHKFLAPGHLFLSNDQAFGIMESASRTCKDFSSQDGIHLAKKVKTNKRFVMWLLKLQHLKLYPPKKLEDVIVNKRKLIKAIPSSNYR